MTSSPRTGVDATPRATSKTPAGGPTEDASNEQSAELWRTRHHHLVSRLRDIGVRAGDQEDVDALVKQSQRAAERTSWSEASEALDLLEARVGRVVVDQRFVEAKIQRLDAALLRRGLRERYDVEVRRILKDVLENRFQEANRRLNRVLDDVDGR